MSKKDCSYDFSFVNKPKGVSGVGPIKKRRKILLSNKLDKINVDGAYISSNLVCRNFCKGDKFPCYNKKSELLLSLNDLSKFYNLNNEKIDDELTLIDSWCGTNSLYYGFNFLEGRENCFKKNLSYGSIEANVVNNELLFSNSFSGISGYSFISDAIDTSKDGFSYIMVNRSSQISSIDGSIFVGFGTNNEMNELNGSNIFYNFIGSWLSTSGVFLKESSRYSPFYFTSPSSLNLQMGSFSKNGVYVEYKNRKKNRYQLNNSLRNYTYFFINRDGNAGNDLVINGIKELYIFNTTVNDKIKDFYNDLLDKYSIPEVSFNNYINVGLSHALGEVNNYAHISDLFRFVYNFDELEINVSYLQSETTLDNFGVFLLLLNGSNLPLIIKSINFSPSLPFNLNGTFYTESIIINSDSSIDYDSNYIEFPLIIHPSSVSHFINVNRLRFISDMLSNYSGVMDIVMEWNGLERSYSIPFNYSVV